jgi:hypothetical protein
MSERSSHESLLNLVGRLGTMTEAERLDYYTGLGHRVIALHGHIASAHYPGPFRQQLMLVHLESELIEGQWLDEIVGNHIDFETIRKYLT